MTEQERTAAELKKALDEVEALRAEKAQNEMRATARKMLSDANISVSDGLLNVLVTKDADSTKQAVDDLAKNVQKRLNRAQQKVRSARRAGLAGTRAGRAALAGGAQEAVPGPGSRGRPALRRSHCSKAAPGSRGRADPVPEGAVWARVSRLPLPLRGWAGAGQELRQVRRVARGSRSGAHLPPGASSPRSRRRLSGPGGSLRRCRSSGGISGYLGAAGTSDFAQKLHLSNLFGSRGLTAQTQPL